MGTHGFQVRRLGNRSRQGVRIPLWKKISWKPVVQGLMFFGVCLRRSFRKIFKTTTTKKWTFGRLCKWSIVLGILTGVLYIGYLWITLPDISDPRSFLASQSTVITDRNGVELYKLFQEENRTFIDGALIPDHMKHAIISIEDRRFYDRGCLDIRAIFRAVIRMGKGGGASTLTRQLARNALDLKQENVLNRKLKELALGCQMESKYTQEEILELYLNWIPFGRNAYGIEQASQTYFGSSAQELTIGQSSILASIPQRPTYFSPYGRHVRTKVNDSILEKIADGSITSADQIPNEDITIGLLGAHVGTGNTLVYIGGRTDQVLQNMVDQHWISEDEKNNALEQLQTITFQRSREDIRAPHFVLWIRDQVEEMFEGTAEEGLLERGGLTIQTTLDWELQQAAEKVMTFHKDDMMNRFGIHNAALLSVQPETREILSYIGNMDFHDEENGGKIDMTHVPRQPGSSFKPFVYLASFEKGYNPATILFDVPTKIGEDEPQNFDGEFMGPLSIRQALGASRNIPAAKAFFLAGGEQNILNLVSSLGAPSPVKRREELEKERGTFEYGWPLALGAAETPLFEMVQAYTTLADGGSYLPLVSIQKISDKNKNILYEQEPQEPKQVVDERHAYQITSILSDESARPDAYWKSQLTVPGFQTAAKTGTSNKCLEYKENGVCKLRKPDNGWLMGYTPSLVTGVWVGNADSSAMFDTAGGLNSASPIWRDYMIRAHKQLDVTSTSFPVPEGIVQPQVSLLSGQLPTECTPVALRRADVFLKEQAPTLPDPACQQLKIDKVTGLLASDACPEAAQEEGSFFAAKSILPERWPLWEEGVQKWMTEQMEIWNASETHSGSLLALPWAPTEQCDPSLTPGRLEKPSVKIISPSGLASYPAFSVTIDYHVGSSVEQVLYELDGKRVSVERNSPFNTTIRVPRSLAKRGAHVLTVILQDTFFNEARDEITIQFGEDTTPPKIDLVRPVSRASYAQGSELFMSAEATDNEGGIKYVQFYLDDILLSTKPKPPYELQFTLDIPPGEYRLRAVAEDLAKHTKEDSIRIRVAGEGNLEALESSSFSIGTIEPVLLMPTGEHTTMKTNDILDVSIQAPLLDNQTFYSLLLVVENEDGGDRDTLLDLSSGNGIYNRIWKAKKPGSYVLLLMTEDKNRELKEWIRHTIEVK